MDQDCTWHIGRPRPKTQPLSPEKGAQPIFGWCLLWPNGSTWQVSASADSWVVCCANYAWIFSVLAVSRHRHREDCEASGHFQVDRLSVWCILLSHHVFVRDSFHFYLNSLVTFCVRQRQGEIYNGHGRLCVCLSVPRRIPTLLHEPGCNLGEWYGDAI